MSIEYHYVVARDSDTGTWFTVDMQPSSGGNAYDTEAEDWLFVDTDETLEAYDNESFGQLCSALDELNKRNTKFLPIVG